MCKVRKIKGASTQAGSNPPLLPAALPGNFEERFLRMEENIQEIMDMLRRPSGASEKNSGEVDEIAYRNAIRELGRGNKKPLALYMARGFAIPIHPKLS